MVNVYFKGLSMLRGMTAYGRAEILAPVARFVVEIRSVNKKYFDCHIVLPKELISLEGEIKKKLSSQLCRGSVVCSVFAYYDKQSPVVAEVNIPLARQLKRCWDELTAIFGEKFADKFTADVLHRNSPLISYDTEIEDIEVYRNPLMEALDKALDDAIAMKVSEGCVIKEDIVKRLNTLLELITFVENNSDKATEKYRSKLRERIAEVYEGADVEERILREVAIYAEKVDIAEEVTRFRGAIGQFFDTLNKPGSIGKTLDFIVQEINREINTIGSKASDCSIATKVVEVKGELERIREQIQNVE